MLRLPVIALSLGWSVLAHGATFSYAVKHVPQDQGDCHQLAAKLGADLHAATGVTVQRAVCTAVNEYGANLLVDYAADQELNLVSTVPALPGIDAGGGIFDTLADCRAALPAELGRFKAATQLAPLIAYCTIDPYSDQPYAIKIDAFGQAVSAPRVGDWRMFGLPVGVTGAELAGAIRAGLVARGIEPSYVSYKEAAFDGIVVAGYYAPEAVLSRDLDVAFTDTDTQCLAAVRDAKAVFAQYGAAGVLTTVCSYDQFLERYNVTTLTVGAGNLTASPAVERFSGFAECQAAKAELTRRYKEDLGRPVIGSVCGKARDEQWAVVLFEQY